ncbi:hypothetical protein TTRE_0000388601 [Trichuris trichiura]|uniref:Uncharacterized protein n=1 Tax=Trichuris trichiura TaxID=36087 RepID=A0A077Z7I4_TRITR|nr:hypothetical protein TTRE_0000388601 [Trichuris trichiura]
MELRSHVFVTTVLLATISSTIPCETSKPYFKCYLQELESIIPKAVVDSCFNKVSQCFQSSGCEELSNAADQSTAQTYVQCLMNIGNDMADSVLNTLAKAANECESGEVNTAKRYFDENLEEEAVKLGIAFQDLSICTAEQRAAINDCLSGLEKEVSNSYEEQKTIKSNAKKQCLDKVEEENKEHVKLDEEALAKEASDSSVTADFYAQKFDSCIGNLSAPETKAFIDNIISILFKIIRSDL